MPKRTPIQMRLMKMRTAKLLKEARLIAEEINLDCFTGDMPNATLTIRLTEVLDQLNDLNKETAK